jgi:hypothetical protein
MISGIKESGKIRKIRDNPLFIGNPLELTQNSQNNPIKAGPGNLTSDSEFFSHNPFYRSVLSFKRRYIFLDFNRSFLGILADNPRKTANISQIQIVTAIPNGYP